MFSSVQCLQRSVQCLTPVQYANSACVSKQTKHYETGLHIFLRSILKVRNDVKSFRRPNRGQMQDHR